MISSGIYKHPRFGRYFTITSEMLSLFVALTIFAAAHGGSTNRIIGAEDAREGEFPFVTAILFREYPALFYSGSILTKDWVLTSALACSSKPADSLIVRAGSIYLDRGGTNRTVEKFIRHDRAYRIAFDVCLLRVSEPFTFSEDVQQATLPKKDWSVDPGDVVTVAGWGYTQPEGNKSNILQKVDSFEIIDRDACQKEIWVRLYPGVNCIRSATREEGVCMKDIADPVLKNGVLVGHVTSFINPCRNRVPAITTSIPFFFDWIRESLGPDAADLKFVG